MARLSRTMILGRWSRSCLALHPSRSSVGALHPWSRNTFRGAATTYVTTQERSGFLRPFGHSSFTSTIGRLATLSWRFERPSAVRLNTWLRNPECGRRRLNERGGEKGGLSGGGCAAGDRDPPDRRVTLAAYGPIHLHRNPPNVPFSQQSSAHTVSRGAKEQRCDEEPRSRWWRSLCCFSAPLRSSWS